MPTGQERALPKSRPYACKGLSPMMRIRIPPTMKAATTAIKGKSSSRRRVHLDFRFAIFDLSDLSALELPQLLETHSTVRSPGSMIKQNSNRKSKIKNQKSLSDHASSAVQSLQSWRPWDQLHPRFDLRELSASDRKVMSPLQARLTPAALRSLSRARLNKFAMNKLDGADIDTSSGLGDQQELRINIELSTND